jgi:hypothetical protein
MSRHPDAEDLAAFSIGGLDPREEKAVKRHVDRCEACTAELNEHYGPAVAVLAESVEQHEPSPELRQSLMATVHQEAAAGAPPPEKPRRSRLSGFLLRPAAGLAAIALVAAAGIGYLVADGSESDPAQTIALPQQASGMGGNLVVDDGGATLHMHDVAQIDEQGAVYQIWVADSGGVKPSAAFVPREDGTATAAVPEAAGDASQVMITREPMPGRATPSGPVLVNLSL